MKTNTKTSTTIYTCRGCGKRLSEERVRQWLDGMPLTPENVHNSVVQCERCEAYTYGEGVEYDYYHNEGRG